MSRISVSHELTPGSLRVANSAASIVVSVLRSATLYDSWHVTTLRDFGALVTKTYETRNMQHVIDTFNIQD